jgi:uncharacterized membrane protein
MMETRQRTLTRALSYRVIATIITAIITGLGTAIVLHVFLTIIHYVHERVWLKIKWGT